MEPTPALLFVYGTLRQGTGHAMAQLLAQQARLVGSGKAPGRLYDLGAYPGMIEPTASEDWVRGDVFELQDVVTTLARLDEYEGAADRPPLFERGVISVTLDSGETLSAWAYLYRGPLQSARRIANGDYLSSQQ